MTYGTIWWHGASGLAGMLVRVSDLNALLVVLRPGWSSYEIGDLLHYDGDFEGHWWRDENDEEDDEE